LTPAATKAAACGWTFLGRTWRNSSHLLMRGKVLAVTVAVQQTELPLGPAAPEPQEVLFPTSPGFSEPIGDQAAAVPAEMVAHGYLETVQHEKESSLPGHVPSVRSRRHMPGLWRAQRGGVRVAFWLLT
jgi:hypothetical protein